MKPSKEELKALCEQYRYAAIKDNWDQGNQIIERILALCDDAEQVECRQVLLYTANALARSRSWASPKRDYDKAFSPFTEAAVRYSEGVATSEDRAVLGLPPRRRPEPPKGGEKDGT